MRKSNLFYSVFISGFLALCSTLEGCSSDVDIENSDVQINENMGTLTFTIGDSDFSDTPLKTRSVVQSDTIYENLGDGYMMETVITPEIESKLTRALTTTTVLDDVKILVIAYRGAKLYKREVATVKSGKFSIHLPAGETFKLLFYSYNEPGKSAPTEYLSSTGWTPGDITSGPDSYIATDDATLIVKPNEIPKDMMWTAIDALTVTQSSKLPAINFKHLFCKVRLIVCCDEFMSAFIAVLGPQAHSNAKVDISTDPLNDWEGAGTPIDSKIESSLSSGEATTLSNSINLIPNETENITLRYEKITINGNDYSTSVARELPTKFTRGHRYIINSKVIAPTQNGANSYIVSPGKTISIPISYANAAIKKINGGIVLSANEALSTELMWTDSSMGISPSSPISSIDIIGNGPTATLRVKAGTAEGNALIAVRKSNGEIFWSWHIWVAAHNPYDDNNLHPIPYNGSTFYLMDRNLGAKSYAPVGGIETFGLYYEWGRKDPFPRTIEWKPVFEQSDFMCYNANGTKVTIGNRNANSQGVPTKLYGIQNPTTYIHAEFRAIFSDWAITDWGQGASTASTNFDKSIFDPCPLGWRLPPFQILNELNGKFNKSVQYIGNSTTSNYGTKPINISATGYWEPVNRNSIVYCDHAYWRGASGADNIVSPWCILRAGGNFEAYPNNNGMGGNSAGYNIRCVEEWKRQ